MTPSFIPLLLIFFNILFLDATLVQGVTTQRVAMVFQNIATVVAGLVIAFVAGWKLSLVILACMPVFVISSGFEVCCFFFIFNLIVFIFYPWWVNFMYWFSRACLFSALWDDSLKYFKWAFLAGQNWKKKMFFISLYIFYYNNIPQIATH